ncbi:MAG TPA: DUF5318 family protein [Mycobacteriales bacterium]|nr:DUF5318 family protein [Mycobacteriales bacterium]
MRTRRQVVDYALQRRSVLADLYAGRATTLDVCDAHPYLLRAAKFHGEPTEESCPVCRKERLINVHYVYGDELRAASGQAKSVAELHRMGMDHRDFTVYVVEVCRSCGWNHLTLSFVLGRDGLPGQGGPERREAGGE